MIDNVIAAYPGWRPSYYRTSNGAEIDLVLSRGRRRIAVECKASAAPTVRRGFWSALADVEPDEAWVIAPVVEPYPIRENVTVSPVWQAAPALVSAPESEGTSDHHRV